jgi:predicted ester cyclase
MMQDSEAERLIHRYVDYMSGTSDDFSAFQEALTEDFFDHVSGQRGVAIWQMVAKWGKATFADPELDIHAIMTRGDRVLIWMTLTATHIGNGFPRIRDIPVSEKRVPWTQVHIFRVVDGRLSEHWAVRDDYALVEAIVGRGPLVAPPIPE